MVDFNTLGFRIFRLRDAGREDEFLLFNSKNMKRNKYSKVRLFEILMLELKNNKIDLDKYYSKIFPDRPMTKQFVEDQIKQEIERQQILIDGVGYKPEEVLLFEDDECTYVNIYNKSKYLKEFCETYNEFDYPNIDKLGLTICGGKENYKFFCKWLAFQLQNPTMKIPVAFIFKGEHGTGKSKFCELVLGNIFGNNYVEIGQTQLDSEFNGYMGQKQFVVANEVTYSPKKNETDKLKNYVADPTFPMRQLYKEPHFSKNYTHWVFISNFYIPIKIERGDRRYVVCTSKVIPEISTIVGNLINNIDTELRGFIYFLMTLDVDFSEVERAYVNEDKQEIIKSSQNSVEEFLDFVKETGGFEEVANYYRISFEEGLIHTDNTGEVFVIRQHVYELYNKFCVTSGYKTFAVNNFGTILSSLNYASKVKRVGEKTYRCVVLNDEK